MTEQALRRVARGYGWEPQDWHLKLARHLAPMAIIGLFSDAVLRHEFAGVYLDFADPLKLDCARPMLPIVARALGEPVIVRPPMPRDQDIGEGYLDGVRKRHMQRLRDKAAAGELMRGDAR